MNRVAWVACGVCLLAATALGDTIAVFYALDQDLAVLLREAGSEAQVARVGSRSLRRFKLGGHDIAAVRMGSGCVETAASAQALLARTRCDIALSVGPAGALTADAEPGAWYRVNRIVAWQRGTSGTEGSRLSNGSEWSLPGSPLVADDARLFSLAKQMSLASGEAFLASGEARAAVRALSGASLVDMNSFGLAVVCADHGIPLYIWRIVSDRADESASEAFRHFSETYAGEGGRALAAWIASLPAGTHSAITYPAIRRLIEQPAGP